MAIVTIHEAKSQLSKLIVRAEAGEEIVIARGKEPVAKLTGLSKKKQHPCSVSSQGNSRFRRTPSSSTRCRTTNWNFGKAALKILLDSHTFVWFVAGHRHCSIAAREAIQADGALVHVSAATLWELATKHRAGKWEDAGPLLDTFPKVLDLYQFIPLPITLDHALLAGRLPGAHKDPFDRMLAAQAQLEALLFLTADAAFETFGTRTLW